MLTTLNRTNEDNDRGKGRRKQEKGPTQPTDWTSNALTLKYRCDSRCRNTNLFPYDLGNSSIESNHEVDDDDDDDEYDVKERTPHPIEEQLQQLVLLENSRAMSRTQEQLKSHTFTADIHTIWTTNLEHFREFQSETEQEGASCHSSCDQSLRGRRDSTAICNHDCQIQSISISRALRNFEVRAREVDELKRVLSRGWTTEWPVIKADEIKPVATFDRPIFLSVTTRASNGMMKLFRPSQFVELIQVLCCQSPLVLVVRTLARKGFHGIHSPNLY